MWNWKRLKRPWNEEKHWDICSVLSHTDWESIPKELAETSQIFWAFWISEFETTKRHQQHKKGIGICGWNSSMSPHCASIWWTEPGSMLNFCLSFWLQPCPIDRRQPHIFGFSSAVHIVMIPVASIIVLRTLSSSSCSSTAQILLCVLCLLLDEMLLKSLQICRKCPNLQRILRCWRQIKCRFLSHYRETAFRWYLIKRFVTECFLVLTNHHLNDLS